MIGLAHVQKHGQRKLLPCNLDELSQQSFAPALPLRSRRDAEGQQMSFFRSDRHHAISKNMAFMLQHEAMIAGVNRIAEIAGSPWEKKNFPFDSDNCVQVCRNHPSYSRHILQLRAHRSFSFRATLLRT